MSSIYNILKVINETGYILAGGIGLLAINNVFHGNHQLATLEGALSFWVGGSVYLNEKRINRSERLLLLAEEADETRKKLNESFQGLFRIINNYKKIKN